MHAEFCRRLRRRDPLIGTIVSLDSIPVVEIIAASGFDWLFIEAEHAPNGLSALERMLVAARDTPCLVRLPNHEPTWIKRALDLGAAGIIVPQVNSVGEAHAIAQAARFTPAGERGLGVCRANGYGYASGEYVANANAATAVLVQAEHVDAVENASSIASVDGIDGVFIGPYDLSASMGVPGEITHPEVGAAIDAVRAAFTAVGKPVGYFGTDPADVKTRIATGFSLVACDVDVLLLRAAATALAADLRATERPPPV
jgi:2-dehydro-3-deoxyglucarate aldolase/4-hydroxy-2-oxoheptanedioate aldolase